MIVHLQRIMNIDDVLLSKLGYRINEVVEPLLNFHYLKHKAAKFVNGIE